MEANPFFCSCFPGSGDADQDGNKFDNDPPIRLVLPFSRGRGSRSACQSYNRDCRHQSMIALFFMDGDLLNFITLTDVINDLQAFHHLSETGMVAIQVGGIGPAVADKEL